MTANNLINPTIDLTTQPGKTRCETVVECSPEQMEFLGNINEVISGKFAKGKKNQQGDTELKWITKVTRESLERERAGNINTTLR